MGCPAHGVDHRMGGLHPVPGQREVAHGLRSCPPDFHHMHPQWLRGSVGYYLRAKNQFKGKGEMWLKRTGNYFVKEQKIVLATDWSRKDTIQNEQLAWK